MQSSIICLSHGSYNLRFPWKEDHPPLPPNFSVCEKRLRSLARQLAHTPDILQAYGDIISEQEALLNEFKHHPLQIVHTTFQGRSQPFLIEGSKLFSKSLLYTARQK